MVPRCMRSAYALLPSVLSAKEDPLVLAVIQGIPDEAAKRGVFPEDILRARFLKVIYILSLR